MMKNTTMFAITGLVALGLGALVTSPLYAEEEVYLYVDNSGEIQSEVADTPLEAISEAEEIDPNSGVIVVKEANTATLTLTTETDNQDEIYAYVDVSGSVQTEVAESPQDAMLEAENIHPNSGVIVIE